MDGWIKSYNYHQLLSSEKIVQYLYSAMKSEDTEALGYVVASDSWSTGCEFDNTWMGAVALPGFGARRGTKLRDDKGDTQKYYEILSINSDKAIGVYVRSG